VANAIPLLEGTNASGGFLVREEFDYNALQTTINRRQAVVSLSRIDRLIGQRQRYTVYAGRPTVSAVAEGAKKPVTGAEFSEVVLDMKKFASISVYTEELLEDAKTDPRVLVQNDLVPAFADAYDANALGQANGVGITSVFNDTLVSTPTTVEFDQTKGDAFALAVSQAIAIIEGNGGTANGIAAGFDVAAHLRDARGAGDNITNPIYGAAGFTAGQDNSAIYGLPLRWTTNLRGLTGAAGAGKVVAIVGDWSHAVFGIRKDLTMRTSDQATITVGGTPVNLWEENKIAGLWESRVGFAIHDKARMFVAIVNAS
jgi:HK97 family phage major capsid protein